MTAMKHFFYDLFYSPKCIFSVVNKFLYSDKINIIAPFSNSKFHIFNIAFCGGMVAW